MKSVLNLSRLIFSLFLACSLNGIVDDSQTYNLLFVLLEQGQVKVAQYPLSSDTHELQPLFTLDLSDKNNNYVALSCNQDGAIMVRSNNEIMCDYCLNWGAMAGVDLAPANAAVQVPVKIDKKENGLQSLVVTGTNGDTYGVIEIPLESYVQSVVAFVVPTVLIEKMSIDNKRMSFSQCCRLGVIVAKGRNDALQGSSIDQEIEFENIIDAMLQDGTIKVKPVSPFMAALRTIGSTIFVKYLLIKRVIVSWWQKTSDECSNQ